uniref:Histone H3 n=1 Tax=Strongyloides venezuelensis TaxID=75913 RepID=A0A0K0G3F4_STRVS
SAQSGLKIVLEYFVHGIIEYDLGSILLVFRTPRRPTAKAFAKNVFINQERKLERSADVTTMARRAPSRKRKSFGSGGSMVAKLKLKGIDGRAPPGVEPAA